MKRQKGTSLIAVILIIIVVLFVLISSYLLLTKNRSNSTGNTVPNLIPSVTKTAGTPTTGAKITPTTDLKTYTNFNLGFEFKYPPSLEKDLKLKEEYLQGEIGQMYCLTLSKGQSFELIPPVLAGGAACSINGFGISGASVDFAAGREGGFTDNQGFQVEGSDIFFKFVGGQKFLIPKKAIVSDSKNPNGVQIVRVKGINEYNEVRGTSIPVPGTPGEGKLGGLINLNSKAFPGIAVVLDLENGQSETTFDQILATFKFLN